MSVLARSESSLVRGMTRLWRCFDAGQVEIPVGLSCPPLVARIIAARGLSDDAELARFLNPQLTHLHDPSLLPGMDHAARRLLDATTRGEPIVVYGDYDVDGVTATTILVRVLRHIAPSAPISGYIPHRVDEGYGLSVDALDELARAGARVIVSVDCGVTAIDPAQRARDLGIDLIITDHHAMRADGVIPDAYAVVHPRLPGCAYPFGELSGAGVAFKLAWRLATLAHGSDKVDTPTREVLLDLLALASLGTIADVVPLVDENRVIARQGLKRLRSSSLVGVKALLETSRLTSDSISAEDVGFRLAPRLNAVGRLGHARDALELLTTDNAADAAKIAATLGELNDRRRDVEKEIFEQAATRAEAEGMTGSECRAIVLADDRWHTGVVGIVCSRLVERYDRPVLLLGKSDGVCHGSGRSIDGFDLAGAIDACRDLIISGGGHRMAAGVKVSDDGFGSFVDRFQAVARERLSPEDLVRPLSVDTDATIEELGFDAVTMIGRLAPFGAGNPAVRVRMRGMKLASAPSIMGKTGTHCSIVVQDNRGRAMRLVGWRWAARAESLRRGMTIDAIVTPKVSTWNGNSNVEPEIVDVRVVEG